MAKKPMPQEIAEAARDAMWAQDKASRALGMVVVDVGPGRARLRMTVRPDMCNGHRICHGGMVFTLADSAFAFACNSHNRVTVANNAPSPSSRRRRKVTSSRPRRLSGIVAGGRACTM